MDVANRDIQQENLRSQFAILERGQGKYSKYLPNVFTEQGIAMLSGVLNSDRAIEVNILIMRAFVKLRDFALSYKNFSERVAELERRYKTHDKKITEIFIALHLLAEGNEEKGEEEIGFKVS